MKNEIKKMSELIGKTISNFHSDGEDVYFTFTDGTFVVLTIHDITEGFGHQKSEINISKYGTDETNSVLVELGIVSEEIHKDACRREEEEWERKREEEKTRYDDVLRKRELEEYERLKNKLRL
jgi:hypothetical protein